MNKKLNTLAIVSAWVLCVPWVLYSAENDVTLISEDDTGAKVERSVTLTPFGESLIETADEAALKALVNLEPGVDFPAYDGSGNLSVTGPVILPDNTVIRWLESDGTTLSGAKIRMWEEHDLFGGELILDSPWRIALIPYGPLQIGANDAGRNGMFMDLVSGAATSTDTLRASKAIGFRTSTWNGSASVANYVAVQAWPTATDGTHVLRAYLDATILGADGTGTLATKGNVSGNLVFELSAEGLWTPGTAPAFETLTDAATITLTCSKYKTIHTGNVTLEGNRTLAISGAEDGMRGVIYIKQDAAGSRTLTLPDGSATAATFELSTDPYAIDRLTWEYDGMYYYWTIDSGIELPVDADAAAFVSEASIADAGLETAINELVLALKREELWDKLEAVYPFTGATSTAHAQDLKGSYDITWSGTITHDGDGVTGDGSSGYGNTGLASSDLAQDSLSLYVYCRTASPTAGGYFIGASTTVYAGIYKYAPGGTEYLGLAGLNTGFLTDHFRDASSDFATHLSGSRTAGTSQYLRVHETTYNDASNTSSGTVAQDFYILARNATGSATNFSNANLAFASIGDGLTSTEMAVLEGIVDEFQTALGRANP